jgi:hypothetical protein
MRPALVKYTGFHTQPITPQGRYADSPRDGVWSTLGFQALLEPTATVRD